MWSFLKKIFSERESEVTVVVLDENNPDGSSSFKIRSLEVIKLTLVVIFISVLIATTIFFATPLGSFYQHQQDEQLREQVFAISQRVESLQDSLLVRDAQLDELKYFLRTVPDTIFQVENLIAENRSSMLQSEISISAGREMVSYNEIIFSGRLDRGADFPSDFPVDGRLTQNYSTDRGHYGIDIAARINSEFRSIADGTVVNTNWTLSYGNIIFVQHADGIMSVYKHASKLHKKQGDFVLKGDILGEVGSGGVLSSGPHLHLEIWKNGSPQNPLLYLNN